MPSNSAMKILSAIFFALHGLASNNAVAGPGELDLSFGGTGMVTTGLGSGIGSAVAVQRDGKIVAAGSDVGFALVRCNTDGVIDASFNGSGRVTTAVGTYGGIEGVAVQSDGKIVAAGWGHNGSNTDFVVVRYNLDGSLDASFNATGRVTTAFGSDDGAANCVAVQSDGKIVAAGQAYDGKNYRFAVVRYSADGSLDTSFNGTGKVITNLGTGRDYFHSVALQRDGKIVAAGSSGYRFAVVRYNGNGSLDTGFNGTGTVTTAIAGIQNHCNSVALQEDGKIVAGGSSFSSDYEFALVRYHPDGSLDTSFNGTGKVTTAYGPGAELCFSVAVQSDRKIVAAGHFNNDYFAVARFNANGSFDTSFNGTGTVTSRMGSRSSAFSMALQADGKIVAAGTSYDGSDYEFAVARFHADLSREIVVEQPANTSLVDGAATVDFAAVDLGSSADLIFNIRNAGGVPLTGLAVTKDGKDFGDFAVGSLAETSLAPGASGSFTVTFSPAAPGPHLAVIHIASDDADENPFDIILTGIGNPGPEPEIVVEQQGGTELSDATAVPVNLGSVAAGTGVSRIFTIRNIGTAPLTGIAVTLSGGTATGDFSIWDLGATHLIPGTSTNFTVFFSPAGPGVRTTTLLIASNDEDENPFEINLSGTRTSQLDAWRRTYFGSTSNSGAGADLSDPDLDGMVNLMEFATGSGPWTRNAPTGQLVVNGSTIELSYTRLKAAITEMTYELEWSETIAGTWSNARTTPALVLGDDGVLQQVKQTVPAGVSGKRFVRLRVTRL